MIIKPIPLLSIVIPVLYLKRPVNKRRFFMPRQTIVETLDDIRRNVKIEHEVIVICNGQDPELISYIKTNSSIDKYCINNFNVGVARSWNIGVELSEARILCFLNDDVSIGNGGLEGLYELIISDSTIGQVGPVGAKWDGAKHKEFVGMNSIADADAIAGFCFMLPEKIFRDMGGFDVFYTPAGFEEVDMSFAIRKAGYRCVVLPNSKIFHFHHHGVSAYENNITYFSTQINSVELHERNKAYFSKKWNLKC